MLHLRAVCFENFKKPGLYQASDKGARRDCPKVFEKVAPHFLSLWLKRRLMVVASEISVTFGFERES
jgi:hypothetical protein